MKKYIDLRRITLLFIIVIILMPINASSQLLEPLRLGVFPRYSQEKTEEFFQPIAQYLSQQIHRQVILDVTKDFDDFWHALHNKRYDIVHYNQYHYVKSQKELGYQLIAKNQESGSNTIAAAVIVRKDSGINRVIDLKGKRVVFGGGPMAMQSYIIAAYLLKNHGLNEWEYRQEFAKRPAYAVYETYFGQAAAGGVGDQVYHLPSMEKIDKGKLKILIEGPQLAQLPWAVNGNMSNELKHAIQTSLVGMNQTTRGKAILQKTNMTGFSLAYDEQYDEHRNIIVEVLGENYCVRSCTGIENLSSESIKKGPLRLGIFPRHHPKMTNKIFSPIIEYLSSRLDREIILVTPKTFLKFWESVRKKEYDIVHYNQFHYIKSHLLYDYQIILKNKEYGKTTMSPVIIVRDDSNIKTIHDLKGKSILYGGGKMAMIAYVGSIFLLQSEGLNKNDYTESFSINPVNACKAVYYKHVDACGSGQIFMESKLIRKMLDIKQLRVLKTGAPLTHLPWAVKGSMGTVLKVRIQKIMDDMENTKGGLVALKAGIITGFDLANDLEYDNHRQLVKKVLDEDYTMKR